MDENQYKVWKNQKVDDKFWSFYFSLRNKGDSLHMKPVTEKPGYVDLYVKEKRSVDHGIPKRQTQRS